ncbi:MAG: hypothetical protein AB7L94_03015 [Kofleriaceae bacterium]
MNGRRAAPRSPVAETAGCAQQATYSQGNAHAPFGIGQFIVELHLDDTVHLITAQDIAAF